MYNNFNHYKGTKEKIKWYWILTNSLESFPLYFSNKHPKTWFRGQLINSQYKQKTVLTFFWLPAYNFRLRKTLWMVFVINNPKKEYLIIKRTGSQLSQLFQYRLCFGCFLCPLHNEVFHTRLNGPSLVEGLPQNTVLKRAPLILLLCILTTVRA